MGMAAVFLVAGSARAEEIKIGGTGGAMATMQILAGAYTRMHPEAKITVLPSLGSSGGIKAVLTGAIQLAVSARPLKDAEIRAGGEEIELGRTPFVFATAKTGKVNGLVHDELVSIYAGRTERWPDGGPIRLVLRPIGDSDSDMVRNISADMRKAKMAAEQRKGMAFAVTDQDAADSLEKIPGALGPTTLAQIISEKRGLKPLQYNNVEPSARGLADGSYPYSKQISMIVSPTTPVAARRFVAFVQSAEGREILTRTGYWVK